MSRRLAPRLLTLSVGLAACQSGDLASPSPDLADVGPSPAATAPATKVAASQPPSATASPAVTPIPGCLPDCVTGQGTEPGALPAGDYTTRYFFGGQLTVTLPAGWSSFEDSTGELGLRPPGSDVGALLFWIDIYAAIDPGSEPVPGVERTADGVGEWLRKNPNLQVLQQNPASIGGIRATAMDLGRSDRAVNVDPDCPEQLRPCVGLFSFPQWGDGFFSEGGPFHLRFLAAEATWGGQAHAIYAMIDAPNEAAFAALEPAAMEIIEGARLPLGVAQ